MQPKILHLTLKKKWFDMVASGEKKEEYRELKMYWADRLMTGFPSTYGHIDRLNPDFKDFDVVRFRNGYRKDSPCIDVECTGMYIGRGVAYLGAPKEDVFIILLGDVIHNLKTN